jgi:hypothetical protein
MEHTSFLTKAYAKEQAIYWQGSAAFWAALAADDTDAASKADAQEGAAHAAAQVRRHLFALIGADPE